VDTQPTGVTEPDTAAPLPGGVVETPASGLPVGPPRTARERLRLYLLGPAPGEEVTAYVPAPAEPEPVAAHRVSGYGRFVLAAIVGCVGSVFIVASAPVYYLAQPAWRLTVPFIPHPGSSFSSIATFVAGLILMVGGWVLLIGKAGRAPISSRARVVAVLLVGCVWCVPIMLGTPLLSKDAYSYAAQGEMASRGIDPSANGPEVLRYGWFLRQADQLWHSSPAPYGPVDIELEKVAVEATDHVASASVMGMRVIALGGIVMAVAGIAVIAASYKKSIALALALGILNPLVLLHLLGGSHNDALMLGFLALGLAAFLRKHKLLAVVLVALATGVKLTAAPALVFMAWNWRDDPTVLLGRRIRDSALVLLAAAAIIATLCVSFGVGAGWISALKGTGQSMSTYSIPTKLGFVTGDVMHWVGLHPSGNTVVAVFRGIGLLVAGLISLVLLLRSPRIGVVRAFAFSSLTIVMLGPVVWPWYLATGFALLAASGLGRWRPTYVVTVVAATLLVWPAGISPLESLQHYQNLLSPLVIAAVIGACYVGQRLADRVAERRTRAPAAELILLEPGS
jgi:alpha-1,6-mannosyltransferase